ncbi:MAG: ATP phosphoribosyltransferase [Proteobacteria bacterium]|nr:MAG: ATP phosphoribosyltransferase [Pseudomonadota bacterium]
MTDLRLAMQKSGRLSDDSIALLKRCGIHFDSPRGRLLVPCEDFPLDLMMVRDDDIPNYVASQVADVGIVGLNVLKEYEANADKADLTLYRRLGFGRCRLSLAVPEAFIWNGMNSLSGLRIASSHPAYLRQFLAVQDVPATVISMSGSVEIAPGMGLADAVCDLVSSGSTLRSNGLREVHTLFESEAVMITRSLPAADRGKSLGRLTNRLDGVLSAQHSRYIMMNADLSSVAAISAIVPGLSQPTVMPLSGGGERVAIHVVAAENVFWETLERLKACGATDILVLPIEKLMA